MRAKEVRHWATAAALTILLALLLPGVARAQNAAPVFESSASYAYGQAMEFKLRAAQLDAPVRSVTLFFRPRNSTNIYTVAVPFTPGDPLEVAHAVDLTQVQLAPYTLVTYWWRLETEAGALLAPERTVAYEDDQFNWQKMERDGVIAHWTGGGPDFGQLILDVTAEALLRLTALIPLSELEPFDVYVYPSSADLRAALRLTGLEQSGGPHPELGVVLVTAVNAQTAAADLRQSVPYAVAHLLLYRATGANYERLPRWLAEGLATTVQAAPNPRYASLLETAVATQTTIPFAQLCAAFPQTEERALLAYAQSAALIDTLRARSGDGTLAELVRAYAAGADCQAGVRQVLGMSLEELDQAWLAGLQPRGPLAQFWRQNGLWLLLLLAGFGLTGLLLWQPLRGNRKK